MPKILSAHIPDHRPELEEAVRRKVDLEYKGKISPYLIDLIEADLENKGSSTKLPPKEDENFFVDLCDMLAGYTTTARAKKAFAKLKGRVSQRAFLEHVLKRASRAARWLSEHPDALYDGLRFWHNNEYSENHKSSSSTISPELMSNVG